MDHKNPEPHVDADRDGAVRDALTRVVAWYLRHVFRRLEGPGITPFYCDEQRVGHFAVEPGDVAAGDPHALFRVFIGMCMFQGRRDTVVMAQQRAMARSEVEQLTSSSWLGGAIAEDRCAVLREGERFESACTVWKSSDEVDCVTASGVQCHVKAATKLFNRMGDFGKMPTSAWMRLGGPEGMKEFLRPRVVSEMTPDERARTLVRELSTIHRVGEKLATMFVSEMTVPALNSLAPWYPVLDGNDLIVVDTNVARIVDRLGGRTVSKTYSGRASWIRTHGSAINLHDFDRDLPSRSPRLVQQALYRFGSRSNRIAHADPCASRRSSCIDCVDTICPFVFTPASD